MAAKIAWAGRRPSNCNVIAVEGGGLQWGGPLVISLPPPTFLPPSPTFYASTTSNCGGCKCQTTSHFFSPNSTSTKANFNSTASSLTSPLPGPLPGQASYPEAPMAASSLQLPACSFQLPPLQSPYRSCTDKSF